MQTPLDILCVSDMCVDLILTGDVRPHFGQAEQIIADYVVEMGGSANIFASQFVKLGGTAGVIGRLGEDAFGDLVRERLRALGIDDSRVRRDPKLKTGLGVALAEPDDRAILTYSGTIDAVSPGELDATLLAECRHWHIASFFLLTALRREWPRWLGACKQAGVTTSLDPNWDPEQRWDGVFELLRLVGVFLPNEAEAAAITGEASVMRAGEKLSKNGPLVVIKRGSQGAAAFRDGDFWTAAPEVPADFEPVDSIGAGDNFDAGFLRGWLLGRGGPWSLALATRCAVTSLNRAGGIEGQLREVIS